jgi:hypothetical protein
MRSDPLEVGELPLLEIVLPIGISFYTFRASPTSRLFRGDLDRPRP